DIAVFRTRDRAMIGLQILSKTSTEVRYLPANSPSTPLKIVLPRQPKHEYDLSHRAGLFYIRTNEGAKNFRAVTAPVADPSEKNWKELVPHRTDVKIEDVDVFADHLVLSEWQNGLQQQIEILDLKTGNRKNLTFPEP